MNQEVKAAEQRLAEEPRKAASNTLSVNERISAFLLRLRDVPAQQMWPMVMAEIRDLKAHYKVRYVRVALSWYRAAVRDTYSEDHPAIKYLHSFRQDIEDYNRVDRAKVFARHQELQPIDPDEFIERALGQLDSKLWPHQVAALALLTGRRPVEIGYTGNFQRIEGSDDTLLFSGQAKGKGTLKPPYEIPVLAPVEDILATFGRIRAQYSFASEKDFAKRKNVDIWDAAHRIFGYPPRELRKIYAAICYHDYDHTAPKPRLSEPAYLASILGHGYGDVQTALSYMAYYVRGDHRRSEKRFTEGLADLLPTLEDRKRIADNNARPYIEKDIENVKKLIRKRTR